MLPLQEAEWGVYGNSLYYFYSTSLSLKLSKIFTEFGVEKNKYTNDKRVKTSDILSL